MTSRWPYVTRNELSCTQPCCPWALVQPRSRRGWWASARLAFWVFWGLTDQDPYSWKRPPRRFRKRDHADPVPLVWVEDPPEPVQSGYWLDVVKKRSLQWLRFTFVVTQEPFDFAKPCPRLVVLSVLMFTVWCLHICFRSGPYDFINLLINYRYARNHLIISSPLLIIGTSVWWPLWCDDILSWCNCVSPRRGSPS